MKKSLNEIDNGRVQKNFDKALNKVISNIKNTTTDPGEKRVITLTIEVCSDNSREELNINSECRTKLMPIGPVGQMYIDDNGILKTDDE